MKLVNRHSLALCCGSGPQLSSAAHNQDAASPTSPICRSAAEGFKLFSAPQQKNKKKYREPESHTTCRSMNLHYKLVVLGEGRWEMESLSKVWGEGGGCTMFETLRGGLGCGITGKGWMGAEPGFTEPCRVFLPQIVEQRTKVGLQHVPP